MPNLTPLIFGLLSLIFASLSARDYFRGGYKLSIAARARLRIAIVFAAVACLLLILL